MTDTLLSVKDLSIRFDVPAGIVKAVDGVSFDIRKGEIFALVGESGCGKSTTAMSIMRLIKEPGWIAGGSIEFGGRDLVALSETEMTKVRGREIGMIFQNPLDSLNPVYNVGFQVSEGLVVDAVPKAEAWRAAADVLRDVQIPDVEERLKSYPHEISGGMRQRVMIGMMLCRSPQLLIADEPTTALDVTIQAGIIDLMKNLREEHDSSILLITHDFGIVADIADRVGVMYAGHLVEVADVFEIFDHPKHPYTQLLMKALPTIKKSEGRLQTIPGFVPNLVEERAGCIFADRCPMAREICRERKPELREVAEEHFAACLLEGGEALG